MCFLPIKMLLLQYKYGSCIVLLLSNYLLRCSKKKTTFVMENTIYVLS